MRTSQYCLLPYFFACIVTPPAMASVTVAFVEPDSYADTGQFRREEAAALREIEAHLKFLGERYLPRNRSLKIEVLDIDLAGRQPFSDRLNPATRILEGKADWPSITLRYVLESGGRVLDERQEHVSDPAYLRRPKGKYSTQSFSHEKQMLEEWFNRRFAADGPVQD